MKGAREESGVPAFRESGQRGLSPTKAVAILMAVTITVGVAGYFVLGAVEHVGTHTVSSCSPHGPRCEGNTTSANEVGFTALEVSVGRG